MSFVGVFDSGIGGLSVLQQLRCVSPTTDFLYVADHAFCPYGTKSSGEILSRALKITNFLKESGAESIVIACNTASVFAREIRRAARLPVLDVISPTCQAIFCQKYTKVALLATQATINSGTYQRKLNSRQIETLCWNCSPLVPLVENCVGAEQRLCVVADCLRGLSEAKVSAVILGCTHFPFLQKEISTFCGDAQIISCAFPTAMQFARQNPPRGKGIIRCYTTGNATAINAVAQIDCMFSHVKI